MATYTHINSLTVDSTIRDDEYLIKDGSTVGTRRISVSDAANELAERSTIGLKRASEYDEAITLDGTDYLIKDDGNAPKRIAASNAAQHIGQMANYSTDSELATTDYILKETDSGVKKKVVATEAAEALALMAGNIAGSEMLEEAIAQGIVDQAMQNAISTTVPQAVQELKTELSEGSAATDILDSALDHEDIGTTTASTDLFVKRDRTNETTEMVTADSIVKAGVSDLPLSHNHDVTTDANNAAGVVVETASGAVLKHSFGALLDELLMNPRDPALSASSTLDATDNLYICDIASNVLGGRTARMPVSDFIDYASQHVPLDTTQAPGTIDGDLYAAIDAIGYGAVISQQLMDLKQLLTNMLGKLERAYTLYSVGNEIPSNANLDNYKDDGVYFIPNAATAQTLSNYPSTAGGRLEVFNVLVYGRNAATSNRRIIQRIYCSNGNCDIYTRFWSGSTWADWINVNKCIPGETISIARNYIPGYLDSAGKLAFTINIPKEPLFNSRSGIDITMTKLNIYQWGGNAIDLQSSISGKTAYARSNGYDIEITFTSLPTTLTKAKPCVVDFRGSIIVP